MLLKVGADPNAGCGDKILTPLEMAASVDDISTCRSLLDHGARPTDRALCSTAWHNRDPECIKLLLAFGANANAHDNYGAINWTAGEAQTEAVAALLEHGASPDHRAPARIGWGPVHFAARCDRLQEALETIVLLLDGGADVNLVDDNGDTPLDTALGREHHQAADLLRQRGGKPGKELS